MTQRTFKTATEIWNKRNTEVPVAEECLLGELDYNKISLAIRMLEEKTLHKVEGIRFTVAGDFVRCLVQSGPGEAEIVEVPVELVL